MPLQVKQIHLTNRFSWLSSDIYVDPVGQSLNLDFSNSTDVDKDVREFITIWEAEVLRRWSTCETFQTNWGLSENLDPLPGERYSSLVFGHTKESIVRVIFLVVQFHGSTVDIVQHVLFQHPVPSAWLWARIRYLMPIASVVSTTWMLLTDYSEQSYSELSLYTKLLYAMIGPVLLFFWGVIVASLFVGFRFTAGPAINFLNTRGDMESVAQNSMQAALAAFQETMEPRQSKRGEVSCSSRFEVE